MTRSGLAWSDLSMVWAAEDGRCEACHRPMDRSQAFAKYLRPTLTVDLDAWVLLCPWCFFMETPPDWMHLNAVPDVLEAILDGMPDNPTADQATAFLQFALGSLGVAIAPPHHRACRSIMRVHGWHEWRAQWFWMPGVGLAAVHLPEALLANRYPPAPVIDHLCALQYHPGGWAVRHQPQRVSRHLPWPATSPMRAANLEHG